MHYLNKKLTTTTRRDAAQAIHSAHSQLEGTSKKLLLYNQLTILIFFFETPSYTATTGCSVTHPHFDTKAQRHPDVSAALVLHCSRELQGKKINVKVTSNQH